MPALENPLAKVIPSLAARLPQFPLSLALCSGLALCRATNQLQADFAFMEGRSLRIVVSDLNLRTTIVFRRGHFLPLPDTTAADVCFSAKASDLVALLIRREDPDTLFFQRRLRIQGDTEIGLTLKNVLDAVEPPAWLLRLLA